MTRLSYPLPEGAPSPFVWVMECDVCHKTRSDPSWRQERLETFRILGWRCRNTHPMDTCLKCLIDEEQRR